MFQVEYNQDAQTLFLSGNFDTQRAEEVKEVLEKVDSSITIDMSDLDFICSAGIGVMILAYRKLKEQGKDICLINLNEHIKKVFKVSLLDKVFNIQ
jgi:anti-sigma B factor antagonist